MKRGRSAGRSRRDIAFALFFAAASVLVAPIVDAYGADRAGDPKFVAELDPVFFEPATYANVVGRGTVSAQLSGDTLTLKGAFEGLPSNAVSAQLRSGLATGVPGPVIATLTSETKTSGAVSGAVRLSRAQVEALRRGALYLQINSVKAPDGNLWGWFLPLPQAQ
ncbi:MAG TPA: CHRD domain-containing protein [Caulobacterales bacterium]|nr:CHRD domain-containing protein [Caulobacterales bacterium]